MLYFEDFNEAIENLPNEWKDSFTTMRQLDLQTQNVLEPLDCMTETFLQKCRLNNLSGLSRDKEFQRLLDEFEKALSYSKEKKEIAQQLFDTYERMMRKLDSELSKFKLELEADNAGITEEIEKSVFDSENVANSSQNRFDRKRSRQMRGAHRRVGASRGINSGSSLSSQNAMLGSVNPVSIAHQDSYVGVDTMMTSLGHADSPGSADKQHIYPPPANLSNSSTFSRRSFKHPAQVSGEPLRKRCKVSTDSAPSPSPSIDYLDQTNLLDTASTGSRGGEQSLVEAVDAAATEPWTLGQEDTKRYCLCNDLSHGEMVACDNESCNIEWFHYGCVGLSVAPKGKWYCPQCRDMVPTRKKHRK